MLGMAGSFRGHPRRLTYTLVRTVVITRLMWPVFFGYSNRSPSGLLSEQAFYLANLMLLAYK